MQLQRFALPRPVPPKSRRAFATKTGYSRAHREVDLMPIFVPDLRAQEA
jgi:hypothetical protein